MTALDDATDDDRHLRVVIWSVLRLVYPLGHDDEFITYADDVPTRAKPDRPLTLDEQRTHEARQLNPNWRD